MSSRRQSGSSGSSTPDYRSVELPDADEKPRTEWHYTQRRAELLQRIRDAGHPGRLNQGELADEYGVSQQQISKDMKRIGQSIRSALDDNRRVLTVDSTVQRAIRGLLEDGDYYKAGQLALDYDEWVSGESGGVSGTDESIAELLSG